MYQFKILLVIAFLAWTNANQYCKYDQMHVLCRFTQRSDACGKHFEEKIPSIEQQREILDWHNQIRQNVSLGREKGYIPPAANLMKMEWDDELANLAQKSANQCLYEEDGKSCKRRSCRSVIGERFEVGQNMGIREQETKFDSMDFLSVMKKWHKGEAELLSKRPIVIDVFRNDKDLLGKNLWARYSQIIWWNSRSIGCGGALYKVSRAELPYRKLVICNYGVGGNVNGTMIYTRGPACSKCPEGTTCDKEYPGLCKITQKDFDLKNTFRTDKVYDFKEHKPYSILNNKKRKV